MEIRAEFDPGAILRHLDAIERQAEELRAELPIEFAAWQSDDLKRKRIMTHTIDNDRSTGHFTRASTVVWPTSRYRVKRRRRVVRRLRKVGQHQRIVMSRRPPLRRELIDQFKERFRDLLDRSF
jgi:hypothetical protein